MIRSTLEECSRSRWKVSTVNPPATTECGRLRRQYDTGAVKALQGIALNSIPPLQVHA